MDYMIENCPPLKDTLIYATKYGKYLNALSRDGLTT